MESERRAMESPPLRGAAEDRIQPPPPPQKQNPLASPIAAGREAAVTGSPARPVLHGAEDRIHGTLSQKPNPSASSVGSGREGPVTGSQARSPLRDAEAAPPQKTNSFGSVGGGGAVTGSPARSPLRDCGEPIPPSGVQKEGSLTSSPLRSQLRRAESPQKDNAFGSPIAGRRDGAATGSPLRPPLREAENPNPPALQKESEREGGMTVASILQLPLWELENPIPAAEAVANRLTQEPTAATKVGGSGRRSMVDSRIVRRSAMTRAAVGLRVLAVILSLISFSVMAADKTSGWAGDSFDRYKEFRYCLSVNVITFVYSAFQVYASVHQRIKRRRIMSRSRGYYFDFFMDQILAYLLMSASSAAASRNDAWVSSFGSDDFTKMIDASVAMSFLAFFALALSSLISVYKLFSWNP